MNRKSLLVVPLLGCLVFAWPGPIQAQQNAEPPNDMFRPINVDFPGGSATDYVTAVRKAAGEANIAVMSDLSTVTVPAVNLNRVSIYSALGVLCSIPRDRLGQYSEIQVDHGGVGPSNLMQLYTIRTKVTGRNQVPGEESLVLSVSETLGHNNIKADDLLTAVQTALEMLKSDSSPAQIRFHEATGLLIARGNAEQMTAITNVVVQLRMRRDRIAEEKSHQASLDSCEDNLRITKERLADVSRAATEWQTRNDLLQKELEHLRAALDESQRQAASLLMELNRSQIQKPRDSEPKPR